MRIEIDIPDWCENQNIYLISGRDLVAYRHVGKEWKVKVERCGKCGKCCGLDTPRQCEHLKQRGVNIWECIPEGNAMRVPLACVISVGPRNINPDCKEEFK